MGKDIIIRSNINTLNMRGGFLMFDFKGKYGMKVVEEYGKIDPHKLQVTSPYQRGIKSQKVRELKKSMNYHGFWPHNPIVINTKYDIVDGQQRWTAAREVGMSKVPVTQYEFPSIVAEASFFVDVNKYNTKQAPQDFWHAQLVAKHPIAEILYNLEESPLSMFNGRISVKHKYTTSKKFSVAQVLQILHVVMRGVADHHRENNEAALLLALDGVSYREIEMRCSVFLSWFFKTFGDDKQKNPIAYSTIGLYAICAFYLIAKKHGHFQGGDASIINKMSKYTFANEFRHMSFSTRIESLINHYNSGKSKHRLSYKEALFME